MIRKQKTDKPATAELSAMRGSFLGVGLFSAIINILMLTGSIYMLQVYDRVLTSRSIPTLVGISLIVLTAFILQGLLDAIRSRMLARIGGEFDARIAPRIFGLVRSMTLRGARSDQSTQLVRDLDTVRGFLSGPGPTAFFDMPFMPIFFIGCFLLHPYLGILALFGGGIIIALTLWTERKTKEKTLSLTNIAAERMSLVESSRRNSEAIQAMGMGETFGKRWTEVNSRFVDAQINLSDASSGIGSAAKIFRMAFQSAVLGFGAYLVIQQLMSPGAMIAASILTSRALAPIESAVAHWKGFVASRQSMNRLDGGLALDNQRQRQMELPEPSRDFTVEEAVVTTPGRQTPLIAGANLKLQAGQMLLLLGQSGAGKSTLMRTFAGVWPAMRGHIRLDGAALEQWNPEQLGRNIGYMPQDVELFDGTVAQNISRFQTDAKDEEIVAAATAAGAHELVLKMPEGYATRIGEAGAQLSGGQRQRIALARALFRDPFVLLLDEPNSNLDQEGEAALAQALQGIKNRKGIAVVVSHRPTLAPIADFVGRVHEGRMQVLTRAEYEQMMRQRMQNVATLHPDRQPVPAANVAPAPHPIASMQTAVTGRMRTRQSGDGK
jgi:ATP-binding cassette, subfamily C, bacterial PrsD